MRSFNCLKFGQSITFKYIIIISSMALLMIYNIFPVMNSSASNVTVITNMAEWQHPVKEVFRKHRVILYKVELYDKTYPVFYVTFPYDPHLAHNDNYFKPLYYETLKANGFWDYSFVDRDFQCKINIRWDKKTKTLSEGVEDFK